MIETTYGWRHFVVDMIRFALVVAFVLFWGWLYGCVTFGACR